MAWSQSRRLLAFGVTAALMTLGCTFGQDRKDDNTAAPEVARTAAPTGDDYAGVFPELYRLAQGSDNATFTAQYAAVWTQQGKATNLAFTFVHKPGHTGLVIAEGVYFTWTDTDMWACSKARHACQHQAVSQSDLVVNGTRTWAGPIRETQYQATTVDPYRAVSELENVAQRATVKHDRQTLAGQETTCGRVPVDERNPLIKSEQVLCLTGQGVVALYTLSLRDDSTAASLQVNLTKVAATADESVLQPIS